MPQNRFLLLRDSLKEELILGCDLSSLVLLLLQSALQHLDRVHSFSDECSQSGLALTWWLLELTSELEQREESVFQF